MSIQPTNSGTFGNRQGLPQVPAGSTSIPQSLLNGVGRRIDSVSIPPNQGMITQVTPGGTSIDFQAMLQGASGSFQPHAFQVFPVKVEGSSMIVQIAEGRIFGRYDWVQAVVKNPIIPVDELYNIPSIGTAPLDPGFTGFTPPENKSSTTTPAGQSSSDGSTTNKPQLPGGGYVSGNAGSITSPGQQGGSYSNNFSVTGNGSYVGYGMGSTYHNNFFTQGNGTYVGGNAGSITSGGNQSGTYNPPLSPSIP